MNNICYQINDNKIKNNNIEMFIKNIKEDMYNIIINYHYIQIIILIILLN